MSPPPNRRPPAPTVQHVIDYISERREQLEEGESRDSIAFQSAKAWLV